MKKVIEITVNKTTVNTISKEIDFPETPKYYRKEEDGKFFPRGVVLFAIIPKYIDKPTCFILVEVTRDNQKCTDFHPTKDCRQENWISEGGLRKQALEIITDYDLYDNEFTEITEEAFEEERNLLLNCYQKD